jgi:hypothetical protein
MFQEIKAMVNMVHKVILSKEEGIVVKDGEPILLTKREYDLARKRFKKRFADDEIKADLKRVSK